MSIVTEEMRERSHRLDGLYAGQCEPHEYECLIEAGLMRFSYEWPGQMVGLAKLRAVPAVSSEQAR